MLVQTIKQKGNVIFSQSLRLRLIVILGMFCNTTKVKSQHDPLKKFDLSSQIKSEGEVAADVVVHLLRAQDSSLVKMKVLDEKGLFLFKALNEGAYFEKDGRSMWVFRRNYGRAKGM